MFGLMRLKYSTEIVADNFIMLNLSGIRSVGSDKANVNETWDCVYTDVLVFIIKNLTVVGNV